MYNSTNFAVNAIRNYTLFFRLLLLVKECQSQPAKPALDIRSLATPKPPRGFLSQVPTHLATPLISSHNLPSPPFTPIVPIIVPSNTHHTQPLHSTPLYEEDKNNVCEVSDIIFQR